MLDQYSANVDQYRYSKNFKESEYFNKTVQGRLTNTNSVQTFQDPTIGQFQTYEFTDQNNLKSQDFHSMKNLRAEQVS